MLTKGGKNHYQWKGPSAQGWRELGIFCTDFSNISDHLHVILNKKKSIICLVRQIIYILFFENYNLNSSSRTAGLRISHNRLSRVIFSQCNGNFLQFCLPAYCYCLQCWRLNPGLLASQARALPLSHTPGPFYLLIHLSEVGSASGALQEKARPPHPLHWLAFSDPSLDALS